MKRTLCMRLIPFTGHCNRLDGFDSVDTSKAGELQEMQDPVGVAIVATECCAYVCSGGHSIRRISLPPTYFLTRTSALTLSFQPRLN